MDKPILIIEDDNKIADLVKITLEREGFKAVRASDGEEAKAILRSHSPILVILDLMLPDIDGIDLCKWIKSLSDLPVLILTVKGEEQDKLSGFSMGADDYMVKPFYPRELGARVKAILRRCNDGITKDQKRLSLKGIELDIDERSIRIGSQHVHLTLSEFRILKALMGTPGRIFTRMELVRQIYPLEDINVTDRTIDVHIRKLRKKMEQNPSKPGYIITIRGQGYKFLP